MSCSASAQVAKELPPLNAKILEYAKSHVGEKVGNGECTSLAIEAIKASGARRFRMVRDGDYVWGEPVASFKDALPGDIVQFRNAVFEGRGRLNGNGAPTSFWHYEFPHHTAIIAKVQERGQKVFFLHQNTGKSGASEAEKRTVKQEMLRVGSLRPEGKVWIYRPVPSEGAEDDDSEIRFDSPSKFKFDEGNPG